MSSSSWQDRRFMFPAGKQLHEGSSSYVPKAPEESAAAAVAAAVSPAAGSTEQRRPSQDWEGDRRFLGRTSREVHVPAQRRSSQSSDKNVAPASPVKPAASPPAAGGGTAAAIAGRRRSSASSSGGLFGGLMANRSQDIHGERRQSWEDMKKPEGIGGFLSNLVNKPADKK